MTGSRKASEIFVNFALAFFQNTLTFRHKIFSFTINFLSIANNHIEGTVLNPSLPKTTINNSLCQKQGQPTAAPYFFC